MKYFFFSILFLLSILDTKYYHKIVLDDILLNPLATTIPILEFNQSKYSYLNQFKFHP